MNYDDLVALWKDQRDIYDQWERKLLHSSVTLRNQMEAALAPPNTTWLEFNTKKPHRYVEIVDFYNLEEPVRRVPRDEAIMADGVLVFGIGVTFDHGLQTYPKQEIYIPFAARLMKHGPEFALFNRDADAPEQHWFKDVNDFCKKLIERYKDYLSHDPHTGFGNKTRMGFLQ